MTQSEWDEQCDFVTDCMIQHVRPYITPLFRSSASPRLLEGSGSFAQVGDIQCILTCEHVERGRSLEFILLPSVKTYELVETIDSKPEPIDVATIALAEGNWSGVYHVSQALPRSRFALTHHLSCKEEMLFFHGFSLENSGSGFADELPISTGCVTQQGGNCSNEEFELFWDPGKETYSSGTSDDAKYRHKALDPSGLSGSLVWNTRFMERRIAHQEWSPEDARVTGIVKRWDKSAKRLIVLPVQKILANIRPFMT